MLDVIREASLCSTGSLEAPATPVATRGGSADLMGCVHLAAAAMIMGLAQVSR